MHLRALWRVEAGRHPSIEWPGSRRMCTTRRTQCQETVSTAHSRKKFGVVGCIIGSLAVLSILQGQCDLSQFVARYTGKLLLLQACRPKSQC